MNNQLQLTIAEKKQLSKLKFSKQKDEWKREVNRIDVADFCETLFIKDFLAARQLNWKILDVNVYSFGTVNMHVDYVCKEGENKNRSLIIFLDGEGELAHINDDDQIVYHDLKKHSTVLIDDGKPHAFINKNKTVCRAIIAELVI